MQETCHEALSSFLSSENINKVTAENVKNSFEFNISIKDKELYKQRNRENPLGAYRKS